MNDLVGARILTAPGVSRVEIFESLDSTQARVGSRPGHVVIADTQTAGRGRAGRTWTAEPGDCLMMSVSLQLEPHVASLVGGLAVALAIQELGLGAKVKWPNDVLVNGRKVAGVLGEVRGGIVTLGMGVNVRQAPNLSGDANLEAGLVGEFRRDELAVLILTQLFEIPQNPLWLDTYRANCATIGRDVRCELPSGQPLSGIATDINPDGTLQVGNRAISVGDVIHLR